MKKNLWRKIFKIAVYLFAVWGFLLTSVFFAMKFGFTKSNSLIDNQSQYFKNISNNVKQQESVANENWLYIENLKEWQAVRLGILKDTALIRKISKDIEIPERLLITPLVGEQLRLMTSEREIFKRYFGPLSVLGSQTQFSLGIYGLKEKTAKQIEVNLKNSKSPYYLGKEYENILDYKNSNNSLLVYADTLEPVKDKSTANIATTTDMATSTNINSSSSSSSPSSSSSTEERKTILLTDSDAERIKRLTNDKDRTYSYLYAGLYLKQLLSAWKKAGYDISTRPEIVATLYNIGFENSRPNADPKVGGAEIDLHGKKYSFGAIGFYFYFSNALDDVFPK